ncbi:hypothetical protein KDW_56960 [Dictyobacter vulcani]|uniref:Dephospho-CoA kinase n=1 Tax=Dictyobacter vulcani TaxID=2607529 RepID=A0A5J4KQ78_9CHLR|nr:dephospho-CoA kinase [Dictyobacter vulcani]GER91534.1 hypothetical protein KDW_56960 [Dictyobacter vulcani]
MHPAVHEAVRAELATVSPEGIAVLDAVKLLEGGSGKFCQKKWLIVCPVEQQLQRLIRRNGLSLAEAQARLQAQPDPTVQRNLVDEVINNGGTLESTQQQVAAAFGRFCAQFAPK